MKRLSRKSYYIRSLVRKWADQVLVLSEIAKFQPQAAYTAVVSGFRHRFTYHIRTVCHIQTEMQLIDNIIDTKLLPALLESRTVSRHERQLLSLPTRLGGIGIPIFSDVCAEENANSMTICKELSTNIICQNSASVPEHVNTTNNLRRVVATQREARYKLLMDSLRSNMSDEQIRATLPK